MTLLSFTDVPDRNWKRILGTVVLVALVAPFVIYAIPQLIGASQAYVVLSSSMSPTIHAGDVVVVDAAGPQRIDEGDVITFESPGEADQLVTHRVVEVVHKNGHEMYRTKGDANEVPDTQLVAPSAVIGIVWFHIPLIGYVILFGSSDLGTLLLVVVPAVLLIVNEVWSLYRSATAVEDEKPDTDEKSADWEWTNVQSLERGDNQ